MFFFSLPFSLFSVSTWVLFYLFFREIKDSADCKRISFRKLKLYDSSLKKLFPFALPSPWNSSTNPPVHYIFQFFFFLFLCYYSVHKRRERNVWNVKESLFCLSTYVCGFRYLRLLLKLKLVENASWCQNVWMSK